MSFTPPPLHPILVNTTAALLPASVLSDVLGVMLRKKSLKSAGWWTLTKGPATRNLPHFAVAVDERQHVLVDLNQPIKA